MKKTAFRRFIMQHHQVKQITPNIWKITHWRELLEEKESLFIEVPSKPFDACRKFSCECDSEGLYHFFLNQKEVLAEIPSQYTQSFSIGENDGIYGLGIHQKKAFNRRNSVCQMLQINGEITAVPFLVSTGGYAVLFDTCAYMSIGIDKPCTTEYQNEYDTDQKTPNQIHVFADEGNTFTYYVILGDTIDRQIEGYRALTGKSPLYPKWTYGFFQSREHYHSQEELLSVAHEFRNRHIPLDCIVQDWNYWGDLGWNAVEWDHKNYPDPKAMIDELHDMDLKLMVSVWPSFGPESSICKELEEAGGILQKPDRKGENWGRVHDPFNEKAADIVWKYMNRNLFSLGVDAWWLDSTEPAFESDNSIHLLECNPCAKGENRQYLNCFALNSSRNVYLRQRKESDQKRVYILTRSGYAGQQAYGVSTWTGDIKATWEVFKKQVSSLLSFSLSGIPYSTTDIGAFFVEYPGGNQNEEYRELYTRWFWFGVFSPLFRSHGTSTPREMWFFGEPGTEYYESQLAASRLRYELMPYIYSWAFRVYQEDGTLMRPLIMDFSDDEKVKDISDTYLFGDSILVHIVTDYHLRTASVYLPQGTEWIDFYTGKRYRGGQTVTVDAPLSHIPVFVKAGSILLMAQEAESTVKQDDTKLKLCIYSGGDCQTFYYQDDNDDYSYENGNYVKIPIFWKDEERLLTIDTPAGNQNGFDCHKTVKIYLDGIYRTTVPYDCEKLELSF